MNLMIGDKIKQLRQRDGRKQEELANALGVSPQAVSRWEANGGYPDMEIIPSIANYFNISIDELFGYSRDRQEKLKSILDTAEREINAQGDLTECIEMLRSAANEFPSEPHILIKLGYALNIYGWKKYGARCYTKDGSDYAFEDTAYNADNVYWQEEIRVFEKVLGMDIPPEDRDLITMMTVTAYCKMGYNDKAKSLASKQNSIIVSRELLMPKATEAEDRDKYQGEAIIALLSELKNVIADSVGTKVSSATNTESVKLFEDLAHLYESVFSDGRCGIAHFHISEIYLHAAIYEARFGKKDVMQAFEYFCEGFKHKKLYDSIAGGGEYRYTAPLVAKVTSPSESFPPLSKTFWHGWIEAFPEELKNLIKAEPQFAECFE